MSAISSRPLPGLTSNFAPGNRLHRASIQVRGASINFRQPRIIQRGGFHRAERSEQLIHESHSFWFV